MRKFVKHALVGAAIAISGCGGGGSSDGGGSNRVFQGSETLVVSAPGVRESTSLGITITISGNQVTIRDTDNQSFTGSLSGNNLTASGVVVLGNLGDGIVCQNYQQNYNGTLEGNNINGTLSGRVSCVGNGIPVSLNIGGTFRASSDGVARQVGNNARGLVELIRSSAQR